MANISRDVPSAMTDFSGYISCRMTDGPTGVFYLSAAEYEFAGETKNNDNINDRIKHKILTSA